MLKRLLTGSSGLLGKNLKIEADRPTHQELDLTKPIVAKKYDVIIHCAAYTKVQEAETHRLECFDINVRGTLNLMDAYPDTPIVYISSEYAGRPMNFYSLSKKLAEDLIMTHPNYLIIRTLFKPNPWPFEKAFIDQWTQGDSVDIIAPIIDEEIKNWEGRGKKLIYVGTGRKRIYDIAVKTKPNVIPNSIKDMAVPIPGDYK